MIKTVFVNTLDPRSNEIDKYFPIASEAFFKYGIGQFIANEFVRRGYKGEYQLWRSDPRIKKSMRECFGSINCIVYPSIKLPKPFSEFSLSMLLAMVRASHQENAIFHFMLTHLIVYHIYAMFIGKKRSFATHLGDPNPKWRYERGAKLKHLLAYMFEMHLFLRSYKMIYTICRAEQDYYNRLGVPNSFGIVYGVCREEMFIIKDRQECRIKLDLPINKKIILQVGRAVDYRGFDWFLRLMDYYADNDDILFIMAGINEWDPYYEEIKRRKCIIYHHLPHTDLPDFYNAADLFLFLITGEKVLTFGGTGYVPIEALYCGTPVVASSLHHISDLGIEEVCRIPKCEEDLVPMIESLLTNPPVRARCREKAKEIFDWDRVLIKYWNDYHSKD